MTALALAQRPALQAPPQWNWPRVGALSGALSLHFVAIALLLVPPAVMTVLRPARDDATRVELIEPPPPVPEPPLPVPKPLVHAVRPRPQLRRVEAPTPKPAADLPAAPPVAAPEPPEHDIAPAAPAEVAPVALAYHTRTKIPYPRDAFARREHGTVVLRVLVGTDGSATAVEIERSSGSRSLDNAARDAVRKWTFQAGTRNGIAQALWARVPVTFDLQLL